MLFEIKNATVTDVKDIVSGTSRSGNAWTKATAIVEHRDGNYTDTFPMLVFGDRIQQVDELKGKKVDIKFNIQGREYGDRWYSDIRLQFIAPAEVQQEQPAPEPEPAPAAKDDPDGDLPF